MKIITLIENLTYKQGLVAEHGLSFYIETHEKKILFDTGQSGLFIQNAKKLGIDIENIDYLVLSHGHYDHTGGLYPFLDKNSQATVYAKKEIFISKYHGFNRFIGTPYKENLLKDRLVYVNSISEIAPNVFIIPVIKIYNHVDTHFQGLSIKQNEELKTDEFNDELFIAIRHNDEVSIITACSHRGITNVCKTATDYFKLPINTILGGFHMKECTIEQYVHIINYFHQAHPKSIGTCHCTGIEKFASIQNECRTPVFYNFTGNEIIIDK